METELTKAIKNRLPLFRPEINSSKRTIRYADEVWTPTGIVDVIRFEDAYRNPEKRFYCFHEHSGIPCKIAEQTFPNDNCHGCTAKRTYTEVEQYILTTCYEVKITVSDFKSQNGHNFHGNDNYYAVPISIYKNILPMVPEDIGVICYYPDSGHMVVKKKCKRKDIDPELLNLLLYNALKKWADGRCLI